MPVICQCPSCRARYELGDQYAGRKIKCPKCGGVVSVPASAPGGQAVQVGPPPGARPPVAKVVADQREPALAQEPDDQLDFLKSESGSGRPPLSPHNTPMPRGDIPAKAAHPPRRRKTAAPAWMIAVIAGSCVAVVMLIFGGVVYYQRGSRANAETKKPAPAAASVSEATFTFHWPESDRTGATLTVNGDLMAVPAAGEVKIKLPVSQQPYRYVLQRNGFKTKDFSRPLLQDDDYTVGQWVLDGDVIDWEQDLAAAEKAAAAEHKNVLIVFDASDAKASAFRSSRFRDAVASAREFAERTKREYVCVYIDNPQRDDARQKVRDLARNRKITGDFGVTVFPSVVVADPRGRPFGIMEGYTVNGVNAFLELLDKWQEDGKMLFDLLEKSRGGDDAEAAAATLDFIELNKLDRFYAPTIKQLAQKLPDGGVREVTEPQATAWARNFRRAAGNPDNAKNDIAEFDRWKAKRSFAKHPDWGAALHTFAALLLARAGENDAAKKKCDEALAFQPKDPGVCAMLAMLQERLTGKAVPLPRGSGTAFCIAEGNYVLTNYHVVQDAAKIMVHLNGEEQKYPARVIADDPEGDMAVLKIDLPAGTNLTPIPFAAADVDVGEEVCAFGWPGLLGDNPASTMTKGVISTIHGKEGYLVMDCKIEHGNSGGPLCSVSGCCVAGMVTAKTATTNELNESYGLAIPVSQLKTFLQKKLPPEILRKIPQPTSGSGTKLPEVVRRVRQSVVYVENYQ